MPATKRKEVERNVFILCAALVRAPLEIAERTARILSTNSSSVKFNHSDLGSSFASVISSKGSDRPNFWRGP